MVSRREEPNPYPIHPIIGQHRLNKTQTQNIQGIIEKIKNSNLRFEPPKQDLKNKIISQQKIDNKNANTIKKTTSIQNKTMPFIAPSKPLPTAPQPRTPILPKKALPPLPSHQQRGASPIRPKALPPLPSQSKNPTPTPRTGEEKNSEQKLTGSESKEINKSNVDFTALNVSFKHKLFEKSIISKLNILLTARSYTEKVDGNIHFSHLIVRGYESSGEVLISSDNTNKLFLSIPDRTEDVPLVTEVNGKSIENGQKIYFNQGYNEVKCNGEVILSFYLEKK